jgi:acyl-CoA hydrolase
MGRLEETVIAHLVKPEDLNHHGTLFAGRMAEWLVEGCFIAAARLLAKPNNIVCVRVHGLSFTKPTHRGDILELRTKVVGIGRTSITVYGQVHINEEKKPSVTGLATFVSVDKKGKPYPHKLKLPPTYLRQNKRYYDAALRDRKVGWV